MMLIDETKAIFWELNARFMTNAEEDQIVRDESRAAVAAIEIASYIQTGHLDYVRAFVECTRRDPEHFIDYVCALWRYLRTHPDLVAPSPELRSLLILEKLEDFATRSLLMAVEAQLMREFLEWIKERADYVA
jgi:hypothetical protein